MPRQTVAEQFVDILVRAGVQRRRGQPQPFLRAERSES